MASLSLEDSIALVKKHGIGFVPSYRAANEKELEAACSSAAFPLAMKVSSGQISHKSDAGGVKINIQSLDEATKVFSLMKELPGFEYVIVQPMLRGVEIIIGGKRDVQFGPTVLFGLGGIYVEVFRDYSVGICPISRKIAVEMMERLKSYPLLKGIRGQQGANLEEIVQAIMKASRLMVSEKDVMELDINPLIATPTQVVAVDARVVTGK
ncbi:MAG TPA: acetyl-CoA synthetase [Candidatus Diapherotrites archaeon]|uniref:Acetyl-CoA synthetase n=1 Tax=Candidatus Iainarchaeum sp. TaxID=3101447 RepID=A0A7J4IVW3_9ARCH|nr:acetyl-CoA synthetase [Candidatus Diapherotrites archaeon]